MDNTNTTPDTNTDVNVVVYEQPTLKEQAVAALVVTGVTIVGTAVMYAAGAAALYGVGKLVEANDNRKARKAAKRAAKEAAQES